MLRGKVVYQTVVFCILSLSLADCSGLSATKMEVGSQKKSMETNTIDDAPFACNPSALSTDERVRYSALTKQLIAEKQEIKELPDGYALRFEISRERIKDAAEFITYEKLCCPFFDFNLAIERNNGALWLELRGREGVKEFIKTEFKL